MGAKRKRDTTQCKARPFIDACECGRSLATAPAYFTGSLTIILGCTFFSPSLLPNYNRLLIVSCLLLVVVQHHCFIGAFGQREPFRLQRFRTHEMALGSA